MKLTTRVQLSAMMFFQYFIWGAFFPPMGIYMEEILGPDAKAAIGDTFANVWIGAIISPFFVGMVADRYFSAQKVLGALNLINAVILYWISQCNDVAQFKTGILIWSILYMPTMALSNSVAFHQTTDKSKDFPTLRVLGTIGWIIAGFVVASFIKDRMLFIIPAVVSFGMGIFSFFLPDTPPSKTGKASFYQILGLDALVLFKDRSYLTFFIGSVLVCIPLSFYYSYTGTFLDKMGVEGITMKMGFLGQGSEVVFMLLMPLFFIRLGVKKMLLAGMAAWVLRYLCFRFGIEGGHWLIYIGLVLHGICYDFFFVTGQIYTHQKAGESIKSSAQGLITFATYGVGLTIGSWLSGLVANHYANDTSVGYDWASLWLVPAAIAGIVLLIFAFAFREKQTNA
jgi:nucleoside transporter